MNQSERLKLGSDLTRKTGVALRSPATFTGRGFAWREVNLLQLLCIFSLLCCCGGESMAAQIDESAATSEDIPIPKLDVSYSSDQFQQYLSDLGRQDLAAQQFWQTMLLAEDADERFRAAYRVAGWLDQNLGQPEAEALRESSDWSKELELAHGESAIPALMIQKREFAKASEEAMRVVLRKTDENRDLLKRFAEISRVCRLIEHQLQEIGDQLKSETAALEVAQLTELQHITESTIHWCYYYRWLLMLESPPTDELTAAKAGLMNLLGISEPDLDGGATFRWYDGNDPLERRSLLGLGLVLTALGEFRQANTCMASLQEHATDTLRSEFFYFQWLAVIRSQRWVDAGRLEESYFRDVRLQKSEIDGRLLNSMIGTLTGLQLNEAGTENERKEPETELRGEAFRLAQPEVSDQVRSLLRRLIYLGWIKAAADWEAKSAVLKPGSFELQMVQLQKAIQELGLVGRTDQQLAPLVTKLEELAAGDRKGIRVWALQQLTDVYAAQQHSEDLQRNLQQRWEMAWQQEERQDLSWRLANLLEKIDGKQDATRVWYRRCLEEDPESSLAELSQLRLQLIDAGIDQRQRIRVLRNAMQKTSVQQYAQNFLLAELYKAWSVERDSLRRADFAAELKPILRTMVESGGRSAKELSAMAMLVNILEVEVANSESEASRTNAESELYDVFDVLDKRYLSGLGTSGPGVQELKNPIALQLLLKALPYWDQAEANQRITAAGEKLQESSLTPQQQYLLLNYVTRAEERLLAEGADVDSVAMLKGLERLVELTHSDAVVLPDAAKWSIRARLLDRLVTEQKAVEALSYLVGFGQPEGGTAGYYFAMGRVYSANQKWKEAEGIWLQNAKQTLDGTPDWFEAKFRLLKVWSVEAPAKAESEFDQMVRLYSEIPSPWNQRIQKLAVDNGWLPKAER